jgi:hypothetical protein
MNLACAIYGVTPEALLVKTNSTIVVTLSGVDETVTQMMYARHAYAPQGYSVELSLLVDLHTKRLGWRSLPGLASTSMM